MLPTSSVGSAKVPQCPEHPQAREPTCTRITHVSADRSVKQPYLNLYQSSTSSPSSAAIIIAIAIGSGKPRRVLRGHDANCAAFVASTTHDQLLYQGQKVAYVERILYRTRSIRCKHVQLTPTYLRPSRQLKIFGSDSSQSTSPTQPPVSKICAPP